MTRTIDLLGAIRGQPAQRRLDPLRGEGDPEAALEELAGHAEHLINADLNEALDVSALVVELADALPAGGAMRARARRARAQALAYASRLEPALDVLEEALAIAEPAGAAVEAARVRLTTLHALARLGRYDEAIAAGERARAALDAAGRPELAARADINLGVTHRMRDDPRRALLHFDRAAPHVRGEPVIAAQLQSNRAEALLDLGRFVEAAGAFEAALAAFRSAGVARAAAIVEGNLGDLLSRQGHLERGLHHFEQARRHLERDGAPGELARILAEQAEAFAAAGLGAEALENYGGAVGALERCGMAWEAARARAGLGGVLLEMGDLERAAAELVGAASAFAALGHRTGLGRVRLLQGELEHRRSRPAEARQRFAEALDRLADRPADAAAAALRLAASELVQGDAEGAARRVQRVLDLAEPLDLRPLIVEALLLRGRIRRVRGETDPPVDDLRRAARLVEQHRGGFAVGRLRIAFLGRRSAVFQELVDLLLERSAEGDHAEAFAVAERGRSRALLDVMNGAVELLDDARRRAADPAEAALLESVLRSRSELNALHSRLDELPRGEGGAPPEAPRDELLRRESELGALESRLAVTRAGGLLTTPADATAVQQGLAAGEALIEYVPTRRSLAAFVLDRSRLHVFTDLIGLDELTELTERVAFQLGRAMSRVARGRAVGAEATRDACIELAALHSYLVQPLERALGDAPHLVVVPHGPLHDLPLHALHDGRRHLIERWSFRYASSASLMLDVARRAGAARGAGRGALVVSVADEAAPLVRDEAAAVAAIFPEAQRLDGAEATAARVAEAAPAAGLIHLACHGRFSAVMPMSAALRLTDRWFTVRDVAGLRLRDAVVTLSACSAGRSSLEPADEPMGLARAFFAAGASTLVMSLWEASDESTAKLMARFYRFWQDGGRGGPSIAAALRAAQVDLLGQRPHPLFWAPFVVMGQGS